MALDWHYPSNYYCNQINSFDNYLFQAQYQDDETEFLCFDPLPTFDDPPPSQPLHYHHQFIAPTNSCIDFSLPMHLPPQDYVSWDDNFSAQFLPFPKKQKITHFPCFSNNGVFPEIFETPETEVFYGGDFSRGQEVIMMEEIFCHDDTYQYYYDYGNQVINGGNEDNIGKIKLSAQSKAARERRRKIKEKTVELGKLIPGSSKMNTAEMFQAGIKYVKFLQAQLGILQSIKTLQKDNEKGFVQTKLNNLPIVTSQLVQEKLYARDKCLVPLDLIPMLQEHCDIETLPSEKKPYQDKAAELKAEYEKAMKAYNNAEDEEDFGDHQAEELCDEDA